MLVEGSLRLRIPQAVSERSLRRSSTGSSFRSLCDGNRVLSGFMNARFARISRSASGERRSLAVHSVSCVSSSDHCRTSIGGHRLRHQGHPIAWKLAMPVVAQLRSPHCPHHQANAEEDIRLANAKLAPANHMLSARRRTAAESSSRTARSSKPRPLALGPRTTISVALALVACGRGNKARGNKASGRGKREGGGAQKCPWVGTERPPVVEMCQRGAGRETPIGGQNALTSTNISITDCRSCPPFQTLHQPRQPQH